MHERGSKGGFSTRRLTLIVIVFVMLVVGLGQLVYFKPVDPNALDVDQLKKTVQRLEAQNLNLINENHELSAILSNNRDKLTNEDSIKDDEDINELKKLVDRLQEENNGLSQELKIRLDKSDPDNKHTDTDFVNELQEENKHLLEQLTDTQQLLEKEIQKQSLTDKIVLAQEGNDTVTTKYDTLMLLSHTYNKFGAIRNADKFTLAKDHIPIVIRVYNKHEYFGYALEHYKKALGIEQTILVISHDGLFPEMFKLVESIDFCQVKQIIHPYSGHILTNRFPGPDDSVPPMMDRFNHKRPWPHTALKHHFWWHMNYVWDKLFEEHNGNMMFFEEDHIPTFDFYETAKALARIRDKECPEKCFIAKLHQHQHSAPNVHGLFYGYDHGNVGLIMNRKNWEKLRNAGREFCTFDDYNWDWTLSHLTAKGMLPELSLTVEFPRAEHLGKCGTHAGSNNCDISPRDKAHFEDTNQKLIDEHGENWEHHGPIRTVGKPHGDHDGWGGWGHPWDHIHCMNQIKNFKQ
eukprot:TRINITY_DN998_c0_g1_i2.p1 TRINITY_DN998_c0_g1~~TRINITY_DN998_c0_g1_i2.p1  ORF type:complete len:519 (-),score=70.40 TRINITY_DN998_c0_g1_i2:96-1652(-)